MADRPTHDALGRILDRPENKAAFDALVDLPGSDLTSLLLAVAARRAEAVTTADLMRQRNSDRFVTPAIVDALQAARIELLALETAAERFEPITLAPTAPFGTHLATGGTPQNNVVTTARQSELTADPTNSLALEAAVRRKALLRSKPRSNEAVRLVAAHRVTRAQRFDGPRSFAHFLLLGLVTAGRDQGGHVFELEALVEHVDTLATIVRSASGAPLEIRLTSFNDYLTSICHDLCERESTHDMRWSMDTERTHGVGYYRTVCFKLHAAISGELVELGDGGDVWWTRDLVQNHKERLVISGLGLERLAMVAAPRS